MTREELKVHCEKQIENCEMWAVYKGEEPHGKVYEEHKLILELLEQEPVLDKLRAEITTLQNRCYALTKGNMCSFYKYECQYKAKSEDKE